jgi:hypothetical protein
MGLVTSFQDQIGGPWISSDTKDFALMDIFDKHFEQSNRSAASPRATIDLIVGNGGEIKTSYGYGNPGVLDP